MSVGNVTRPVEIALVYQSLLGIYGDQGNAKVLMKRLQWRGIEAKLTVVEPGDPVPPSATVYLLGGGEDNAQVSAVRELKKDGNLFRGLDDGAVLFAVCAGYQICGNTFTIGDNDEVIEGLGVLDVDTRRAPERAVGELLSAWTRPDGTESLMTGFENHGGYTTVGPNARPLGRVQIGVGNADDGTEGAVQDKVIATYPHGPVLARNADLADYVLETALERKLEPLDRPEIDELHRQRVDFVRRQGLRR